MVQPLDLSSIGVVDNHCHALDAEQATGGLSAWRARFTESPHDRMRSEDAAETAFYRRLMRRLAVHLGLPAECDEASVLAERDRRSAAELTAGIYAGARISGVVIDTGYPPPEAAMPREDYLAVSGVGRVDLLRLELLFQELLAAHDRYDDVAEELRHRLEDLRAQGFAGFKSIAGYRTGLGIERWSSADVEASFASVRREAAETGAVHLGHKPILDSLLHVSLAAAAAQELPVQFHVGYGDPDADLRSANPLELRAVLEEPAYRAVPIVLLHGCWPYFREGAYLAAVYQNAYLDLSYGIPFLSTGELTSMTRAALGSAPFTKLMYSSDGTRVPELHWMGAIEGRASIGRVLAELVDDGDLSLDQAMSAADQVLGANAWRLYGFPGSRS